MPLLMVFVVMHVQANFLPDSPGFYENKDKFNPSYLNLPKFYPARILCYTVVINYGEFDVRTLVKI